MHPALYHGGISNYNLIYSDEQHPVHTNQRYIAREVIISLGPRFHLTPSTPIMYQVRGKNERYCAQVISSGAQGARIRVLIPYDERTLMLRSGTVIFPPGSISGDLLQFPH
jgi:hypothetical protein